MGSGSSRSSRVPRRRRSPDRRAEQPGAAASQGGPAAQTPGASAKEEEVARAPSSAAPLDGREETLRLLDQLLAESEAWGPQEPTPRGPTRPRPAAGAGSLVLLEQRVQEHPKDSRGTEASGCRPKRPGGQSAISYDYSEEELMASIEQEYCH